MAPPPSVKIREPPLHFHSMGKAEGTALLIQEGYQLGIWPFLPKNCMKMKAGEMFSQKPLGVCSAPQWGARDVRGPNSFIFIQFLAKFFWGFGTPSGKSWIRHYTHTHTIHIHTRAHGMVHMAHDQACVTARMLCCLRGVGEYYS